MNFKSTKKIIGLISPVLVFCLIFTGCLGTGTDDSAGGTGSTISMVLSIVVLFAVFYFFMIRPENKKKKQAEEMRNNLGMGDKIITIGGIAGEIVNVTGDYITIESGEDRVRLRLAKWAISRKEK